MPSLVPQGDAEKVMGRSVLRVSFAGLPEEGDDLVTILLRLDGTGDVLSRFGVFWGEFENFPVGGNGLVQVVLPSQGQAEVKVGIHVFRVEFDGPGKASDGIVQLVLLD